MERLGYTGPAFYSDNWNRQAAAPSGGLYLFIPQNPHRSCNICLYMSSLAYLTQWPGGFTGGCNPQTHNLLEGSLNCGACMVAKKVPSHHLAFLGIYLFHSYGLSWVWMLALFHIIHLLSRVCNLSGHPFCHLESVTTVPKTQDWCDGKTRKATYIKYSGQCPAYRKLFITSTYLYIIILLLSEFSATLGRFLVQGLRHSAFWLCLTPTYSLLCHTHMLMSTLSELTVLRNWGNCTKWGQCIAISDSPTCTVQQ